MNFKFLDSSMAQDKLIKPPGALNIQRSMDLRDSILDKYILKLKEKHFKFLDSSMAQGQLIKPFWCTRLGFKEDKYI